MGCEMVEGCRRGLLRSVLSGGAKGVLRWVLRGVCVIANMEPGGVVVSNPTRDYVCLLAVFRSAKTNYV